MKTKSKKAEEERIGRNRKGNFFIRIKKLYGRMALLCCYVSVV